MKNLFEAPSRRFVDEMKLSEKEPVTRASVLGKSEPWRERNEQEHCVESNHDCQREKANRMHGSDEAAPRV